VGSISIGKGASTKQKGRDTDRGRETERANGADGECKVERRVDWLDLPSLRADRRPVLHSRCSR